MTEFSWRKKKRDMSCRLCGYLGPATQVLTLRQTPGFTISPIECPECRSLEILDNPREFSQTQAEIDSYIEVGAGIDTIAGLVCSMPRDAVSSFVDVGCGYGVSLALARDLCGWTATGFEPSNLGEAGALAFGVDIRHEYFGAGSDLPGAPDFILSSEVVEHVPDPLVFLETLRTQMHDTTVLLLTTPNRAVVTPEHPEGIVEAALSPGFHVFVASAEGMRVLLSRAGFEHVRVVESGQTLLVGASMRADSLAQLRLRDISRERIDRWYESARNRLSPGSSTRLGVSRRLFDSLIASGKLAEAQDFLTELMADFAQRYGSHDVRTIVTTIDASGPLIALPTIASIAYGRGIIALVRDGDAYLSADEFTLCIDAVEAWRTFSGQAHLHMMDLAREAELNRLIALARVEPAQAAEEAMTRHIRLRSSEYVMARVLVEAVAAGNEGAVGALISRARAFAPELARSDSQMERTAGQDALYMTATVYDRKGDTATALSLYLACFDACRAEDLVSTHEINLMRHIRRALARIAPESMPSDDVDARTTQREPLDHAYLGIDSFWRDASGVFVEGWAHLGETGVRRITVAHGGTRVVAERKARLDNVETFTQLDPRSQSGFRAYLAGGFGEHIEVCLTTTRGDITLRWKMPDQTLPAPPSGPEQSRRTDAFHDAVRVALSSAPPGPVLAIGIRTDDGARLAELSDIFAGREIVGVDIHPGNGIDVIADAHDLRDAFADAQFAAVFSESVLEHLQAPWVAVLEMLRVLKVGGVAAHMVPWVWPTHSQPNDFFRMSTEGLQSLFSPDLGFETIRVGEVDFARVVPEPNWRTAGFVDMPTLPSAGRTWIVTQKSRELPDVPQWPFNDRAGRERARRYPVDGIQTRWNEET